MQCVEVIEREYLSIKELALYSGISEKSIRAYLDDFEHPLPYYRIGPGSRIIRVKRSDFEHWLSSQKIEGDG